MQQTHMTMTERADLLAVVREALGLVMEAIPTEQAQERQHEVVKQVRTEVVKARQRHPRLVYAIAKEMGPRTKLTEIQRRVYQWIKEYPETPAGAIQTMLTLTEGQLGAALKRLEAGGLVRAKGAGKVAPRGSQGHPKAIHGAVEDDLLRVLQPGMFEGLTQAEGVRRLLGLVKRPISTRVLVVGLELGGMKLSQRHARTNLHKTLRNQRDMVLVRGQGWMLRA